MDVAQLVEHQIVALVVVGSIPTIHPREQSGYKLKFLLERTSGHGAIGSALALGARGCQFESGRPDQWYLCGLLIKGIYAHLTG